MEAKFNSSHSILSKVGTRDSAEVRRR